MIADPICYIDPAEFRDAGFLQEVNRQFFHPLGLALEVDVVTGRMRVWDYRDDPEGIVFTFPPDVGKADRVAAERERHAAHRTAKWGWVVQPVGEAVEVDGGKVT